MTVRCRYPFLLLVVLLAVLASVVSAATAATSFCKCTCGSKSTIFPLKYEPPIPPPDDLPSDNDTSVEPPPHKTGTCTDCNRSYCLEQNVDTSICADMKEEDIFTNCFQRDSAKDEAIIYGFIVLTVGLLVYAMIRPWVRRRAEAIQERRAYSAVASGQGPG